MLLSVVLVRLRGEVVTICGALCDQLARSDCRVNFARIHQTGRHTPIPGCVCETAHTLLPRRATPSPCRILTLRNLVETLQAELLANGLVHLCPG